MMKILVLMMASAVSILYMRGKHNILCFEPDPLVSKWGIITALQCLMSRLYSGTVLCVGEPWQKPPQRKNVNRNILISKVYIHFVSNVNIVPTRSLNLKLLCV